jgi:predicted transcriptional regulator
MNARDGYDTAIKRKAWLRPVWGALLGGLAGFLLLHSYVMLLASTGAIPWHSSPAASVDWSLQSILALERSMIPMAVPFALFGAALGLMAGSYLNRAHRLQQLLLEQEKNATALETVRAFTDTLSHYLLNANMIIGGQVRHCRRYAPGHEVMESLRIIEEQGMIIDAAIGALSELARIVILRESPGQVPMIDLARELENRLRRIGEESPFKESAEP